MSIVMEVHGIEYIINEETDITESAYDSKDNVMRIVIHDNSLLLEYLLYNALLGKHSLGDVTFHNKDNGYKLNTHDTKVISANNINGMQVYEIESKKWQFDPIVNIGGELLVQRIHEYAKLPTRAHTTDAGLDIHSIEDAILEPFTLTTIHTGIAIQLPDNTYGKLEDRSSLGLKSVTIFGGVIDKGYTGEIAVLLYNADQNVRYINKGDKVAQLIIIPIIYPTIKEVNTLNNSPRNKKGFGSTGK